MENIEKLNKILEILQKIMRIQDWDIEIKVIDKYKMKDLSEIEDYLTDGFCIPNLLTNTAFIYLNKDSEFTQKSWYLTLVHELFHVVTARYKYVSDRFEDKDLNEIINTEKESLVEHLAKIFVNLYPQDKILEDIK